MANSIRIDDDPKVRIQTLADEQKRSPQSIIVDAIEQYVDRAEKRAEFTREAQESWEHYKETGLHLTWDEVSAWLKTWGTDAQTELPKCHK